MGRLNDLAGVMKTQIDSINQVAYELVCLELDEQMAEVYMETVVRDLNALLDKMDADMVTTDKVDSFGREIIK